MITIGKMYKTFGKLIAEGHARKGICIDKSTFKHPLESDGVLILEVAGATLVCHPMASDDGGTKVRADGTECRRTSLVLDGGYGDQQEPPHA